MDMGGMGNFFGNVNAQNFDLFNPARTQAPGFYRSNPNRDMGFLGQSGQLYGNQFSAQMAGDMPFGMQNFAQGVNMQDLLETERGERQGIVDEINSLRNELMGDLRGNMNESMDLLGGFARGEGLVDLDAEKGQALGELDKYGTMAMDRIDQGQKDALGFIEKGMNKAIGGMEDARHGAMTAQAISAGRAAGEQSVQMASQMAAAGASPAQIVGAQIQADASRGQAAAATIAQTGSQYDSAIAGLQQNKAQMQAGAVQSFTQMFSQAALQTGQAKANMVQAYSGMKMSQNALQVQAATAMSNAAATGSNAMVNIISALPPTALGSLELMGQLFGVAQQIQGAGYDTFYPGVSFGSPSPRG